MKSCHIHIKGRVQGVGFRPFIFNLAQELSLKGSVSNTLNGVHIRLNATPETAEKFIESVRHKAPKQSLITGIDFEETNDVNYLDFSIQNSDTEGSPDLMISPDFAVCPECKTELLDPENRRYLYPFITCTNCGPRFSIEKLLPYDRGRTAMSTFMMCPECEKEYSETTDRRFYSQTNSCPNCKISQWVVDVNGTQVDMPEDKVIDFISEKIIDGCVTAVKGIGGYLLICDAANEKTVQKLRTKKNRTSKPFALLYPDLETVRNTCILSEQESVALEGPGAPIVLLNLVKSTPADQRFHLLAPKLDRLGIMLPYAPVLELLAKKCNRILLATSGNLRGNPIIFGNKQAVVNLGNFADFLLLNNREIYLPQDDSVLKFSKKYHRQIMIRRSRGYAPAIASPGIDSSFPERVLSMGALLKSTFCIWQHGRCHVSQYLGDTDDFDAQLSFENTLKHFRKLLKFEPEVILVDKHPAYFSSQLGKSLAQKHALPLVEVQHHEAHFYAVLAENELLHCREKILGVVFDGTGMGTDGAVWGGEFFIYGCDELRRINHIKYFPHILGDKMSKEPALSAFAVLHSVGMEYDIVRKKFSEGELNFYERVLEGLSVKTSSVGRIFDGVASMLGLCDYNTFEGEAAMLLECEAQKYCDKRGSLPEPFEIPVTEKDPIDIKNIVYCVAEDIKNRIPVGETAAKFHVTLAEIILKTARLHDIKRVAFSGGVFQNALLTDMLIERAGKENILYFHKELSPNDECISYGQLAAYYMSKSGNGRQV